MDGMIHTPFDVDAIRADFPILASEHRANAMAALTDQLSVVGRRIVVMAAPGDRRDEDIVELAKAAAGHFDIYICKRDDHTRGRRGDEVPTMLRDNLVAAGVEPEKIEIIEDEQEAVVSGLSRAKLGDLLVVFADNVARTWKQIIYFKPDIVLAHEKPNLTTTPGSMVSALKGLDDYTETAPMEIRQDERGVFLAAEEGSD